ncbi:hypothetical protein M0804_001515 [Polistes exclamans]|nr:hypothetical protein M0804_001515 [Polistes exclamans]
MDLPGGFKLRRINGRKGDRFVRRSNRSMVVTNRESEPLFILKADKETNEAPLIAGITLAHFFAGIYHRGCTYWRKSKEDEEEEEEAGGSEKNEEDEDEDEDEKKKSRRVQRLRVVFTDGRIHIHREKRTGVAVREWCCRSRCCCFLYPHVVAVFFVVPLPVLFALARAPTRRTVVRVGIESPGRRAKVPLALAQQQQKQKQQQQQPPLVRREPIDIFADSPAAV